MISRSVLIIVIVASVLAVPRISVAAQERGGLRDMVYVSPMWAYSIRWYTDEWTVDEQTSQGGVDTLQLEDESGNSVGFEGRIGYRGDSRDCLDDQVNAIQETYGLSDITVV